MSQIDEKEFKIKITNFTDLDGHWILNKNQNVPAIIEWTCPICGYENVRDCFWESFELPPLGNPFVIKLICDNHGCQYVRAIEIQIDMTLSLKQVLPQTVDEMKILEKLWRDSRYAGKTPLTGKDLIDIKNSQKTFLKLTKKPNILE